MEFEHLWRHAASQVHSFRKGAQMSCDVLEYAERKPVCSVRGAIRTVASAFRRMRGRSLKLDLETTSDYMKRDLGVMDWDVPRREDERLR
ncbi:hypothetical protein CO656_06460 [Sinorhizobium sp. FG01]|nr:hypothetical protein CO656_06460 [Sinorhizobium sp. FG01]